MRVFYLVAILTPLLLELNYCDDYFINLGSFLNPFHSKMLNANKSSDVLNEYNNYLNEKQKKQQSKNKCKNLKRNNKSNKDCKGDRDKLEEQKNKYGYERRMQHKQAKEQAEIKAEDDLYRAMGIPQQILEQKIWPVHIRALISLNQYFPEHAIKKKKLYKRIIDLKQMLAYVQETYLKNITTIVLNSNNTVIGTKIYSNTNNATVIGIGNYVFDDHMHLIPVKGRQIVRIDCYDIHFLRTELILTDPVQAIDYLCPD